MSEMASIVLLKSLRNNHFYCLQGGSISAPASTNQSSDEEGKEVSDKLIENDIATDGSEIKTKKHKKSKKKSKHTDEEKHYNVCDNNSDDDIRDIKSKKKKKKDKRKSEIEYTDGQPVASVEIDDTNKISRPGQKDENVNDIEDMLAMQGGSLSAPASANQSSDEEGKEASSKLIEDDITTDGSEIKTKKHKKSKKKSKHTDEEKHCNVCDHNSDDDIHDKKSKKKKKKDKKNSEIEYTDGQPDAPREIDDTNEISQLEQKDENVNDVQDMPVMDDSKRKKKKKKEKEQSHDTTSEVTGADSYHDTIQNTKAKATKRKRMEQEVQEDEEDETTLGRNGNNEDTTCTDLDELVPRKKRKEQREDAVDYDCSSKLEKSKISENCETNIQISETKTIPEVSKKKKAKRDGSEKFSNNPSKYFKGSNLGNIPGYGR